MEPERQETYERIPWETLEKASGDRQWIVYAVAGAVVLGALAYSFMRNQPTAVPPTVSQAVASTTIPMDTDPETTASTVVEPADVESPVVVAEADLYAVDPERLIEQAVGHAQWVAVEYMAVDGSGQSHEVLSRLLPRGVPLPEAPEGTQVFVDWVGTRSVTQTGPVSFDVRVLVRSLVSEGDGAFARQPPTVVEMAIEFGDDGSPRVADVPTMMAMEPGSQAEVVLVEPPSEIVADVGGEVAGGIQRQDGGWDVVVMSEGADGVKRPVLVSR